jgi:hypothetical protein
MLVVVSAAITIGGYCWYSALNTADFNFGPGFLMVGGFIGIIVGAFGLVAEYRNKKH